MTQSDRTSATMDTAKWAGVAVTTRPVDDQPKELSAMRSIRIPLHSRKYPGLFAIVDEADADLVSAYRGHPHKKNRRFYAIADAPLVGGGRVKVRMHRLVLGLTDPNDQADHVNHDGLDNRRSNLRKTTNQQNGFNQRSAEGSTSRFRGVSWTTDRSKWHAQIRHNNKLYHLGHFDDEIDAARAYDEAARRFFGEFAFLNLTEEDVAA